MSGKKIIEAAQEALAIAKGEMACAGLFFNGFHYVRREDFDRQAARIEALEIEVEAAKRFGGGFYADCVQEETREAYRDLVRASRNGEKAATPKDGG